ncbi:hypothetical protein EVAR_99617_1 [Eumeta japonica]|uniref:Uncharacterized protein n=1 Tax=Eumeta variegata TaxID=151549 RepID=A0A4C1SFD8_EUMVA|nr:hypothetical protein EVAR_99617_1 [Eumeta japonica]
MILAMVYSFDDGTTIWYHWTDLMMQSEGTANGARSLALELHIEIIYLVFLELLSRSDDESRKIATGNP